jgi:hypothetical protein
MFLTYYLSVTLFRDIEALGSERNLLEQISKLEQMSSAELLLMLNMNVFPAAEVVSIRRELQLLKENAAGADDGQKDSGEGLEQELQVADKKSIIFRARRLDEERLLSQQFSDVADNVQYNIDHIEPNQHHPLSSGGYRKPVRDSARF